MTHRKGAEATSVERWAVTPSIRLEGAAASRISTALSRHGSGGVAASGAGSVSRSSRRRQTTSARAATISRKAQYPPVQPARCPNRVVSGSMTKG